MKFAMEMDHKHIYHFYIGCRHIVIKSTNINMTTAGIVQVTHDKFNV
jgi:hypothetical protein